MPFFFKASSHFSYSVCLTCPPRSPGTFTSLFPTIFHSKANLVFPKIASCKWDHKSGESGRMEWSMDKGRHERGVN